MSRVVVPSTECKGPVILQEVHVYVLARVAESTEQKGPVILQEVHVYVHARVAGIFSGFFPSQSTNFKIILRIQRTHLDDAVFKKLFESRLNGRVWFSFQLVTGC